MPSKRTLFLAHAGELAYQLVRTMRGSARGTGLVAGFLRSYAQRFNRAGLLGSRERFFEIDSTITREALLAIAVEIHRRLPQAFAQRRAHTPDPEEAALADSFFAEFLDALGRALESRPSEARAEQEAFRLDLESYERWTHRSAPGANSKPHATSSWHRRRDEESPFPDRCALLLDPAMMEQARRAAAEFETEFIRTGARIFAHLGAQARQRPRHPTRTRQRSPRKRPRRNEPRTRPKKKQAKKKRVSRQQLHGRKRPGQGRRRPRTQKRARSGRRPPRR